MTLDDQVRAIVAEWLPRFRSSIPPDRFNVRVGAVPRNEAGTELLAHTRRSPTDPQRVDMLIDPRAAFHPDPLEVTVLHELIHAGHLFAGAVGAAEALEWTADLAARSMIAARDEILRLRNG
jgi:hypothetical protein